MTNEELNEMIDWRRSKMSKEKRPLGLSGKRLEGYREAMLQVMSYLQL